MGALKGCLVDWLVDWLIDRLSAWTLGLGMVFGANALAMEVLRKGMRLLASLIRIKNALRCHAKTFVQCT